MSTSLEWWLVAMESIFSTQNILIQVGFTSDMWVNQILYCPYIYKLQHTYVC